MPRGLILERRRRRRRRRRNKEINEEKARPRRMLCRAGNFHMESTTS
jgi:hypothetical protein